MSLLKRTRSAIRASFTNKAKCLQTAIDKEDLLEAKEAFELLINKYEHLEKLNHQIMQDFSDDVPEEELTEEVEGCEKYTDTFLVLKNKLNIIKSSQTDSTRENSLNNECASTSGNDMSSVKFTRLVPVEYDLKPSNWLAFWGQYRNIFENKNMSCADKHQYLLRCLSKGCAAHKLVESYPPFSANYDKMIDHLKRRFGRDDLIVESCVRDLLTIVIDKKQTLAELSDFLGTRIRTLNSLGMGSDKYQLFLFPLLEKCLPKNILELWLWRTDNSGSSDDGSLLDATTDKVAELLAFIEKHVENNEHADALTGNTFLEHKATAAGLHVSTQQPQRAGCIFCDGKHASQDCGKVLIKSVSDRRNIVKNKKGCFKCLNLGHSSFNCKKFVICAICRNKHYPIICDTIAKQDLKEKPQSCFASSAGLIYLKTLRANLVTNNGVKAIRIFIDDGSHQSYIREGLVDDLKISHYDKIRLSHGLFGGTSTNEIDHKLYNVRISELNKQFGCEIELSVLGQRTICHELSSPCDGKLLSELKARGINLTDTGSEPREIDILVGSDMLPKILTGRLQILPSGIVATETKLGWCIQGVHKGKKSMRQTLLSLNMTNIDLSNLWSLETLGIEPVSVAENEDAWEMFQTSKKVNEEGRYVVALPWKTQHPPLPSHRAIAETRLRSVTSQLKTKGMFDSYDNIFKDWEKQGIIEEDTGNEDGIEHFLPHHPVYKPQSKTTQLRPVFAANVKIPGGISLNDCLHTGVNLIPLILPLLIKFRLGKYGIVSDVKRAFLEIELVEQDRNVLKFFWWRDGRKIIFRHCRNIFGVISSPFILNACIKDLLDEKIIDPQLGDTAKILKNSIYVDNCVCSFNNDRELFNFKETAKQLLAIRKFDLRGWVSNHPDIREENSSWENVLGIKWEIDKDCLFISRPIKEEKSILCKRELTSFCNSVYDPLGVIATVMLTPKHILQKAWKSGCDWDTPLPPDLLADLGKWKETFHMLEKIFIPRCAIPYPLTEIYELHAFSDASGIAYGSCIFIRQNNNVRFLLAKTRLCPIDPKLTLPRKELLGCLLSARLVKSVLAAINNSHVKCYYWTDSTVALCWINNKHIWKQFVNNRVKEILSVSSVKDWHFVRGVENPADALSRGLTMEQFISKAWLEGPMWLRHDPSVWPSKVNKPNETSEALIERKKVTHATLNVNNSTELMSHRICHRVSNYDKILRICAYILRFSFNLQARKLGKQVKVTALTAKEIDEAEKRILKLAQIENFEDISKKSTSLRVQKGEDGLLRLHTKLVLGNDSASFQQPLLLVDNIVTQRLIEHTHKKLLHAGFSTVLVALRQKVWIIRGRQLIKKYLRSCVICAKNKSRPIEPLEAPLPVHRMQLTSCFEICGVDYCGPLYLREHKKAWIALYTCAVYRAVHLELTTSLSTEAFLQTVRRMEARRGHVDTFWCDNGTNFSGAANLIDEVDWEAVAVAGAFQRKKFRFITPSSPWFGGWWEILVKLVKRALRKTLGNALLTYEEMSTVLCDVERVINSRPLTYVSSEEELISLTPNHFLHDAKTSDAVVMDTIDEITLNCRLEYIKKVRNDLRSRFRDEYLSQLVNFRHNMKPKYQLKVGEIVLVASDNKKRLEWPMGRVLELLPGKDGEVRIARVKTATIELLRPIKKLYPLEVTAISSGEVPIITKSSATGVPPSSTIADMPSSSDSGEYVIKPTTTRAGRTTKQPQKFDL